MALHPYFSQAYDKLLLGNLESPGIVTLSGHGRPQDWDVKKAKGTVGATTKHNGSTVAQFVAEFHLAGYTGDEQGDDDFAKWDAFQDLVHSLTSGPRPKAVPVYHPDLARNNITTVTNGEIGGMRHDGMGGALVQIKFLEYIPPRPRRVSSPERSSSTVREGVTTLEADPNVVAKVELQGLQDQAGLT